MYSKKGGNSAVPSEVQAREKLAVYVYEYLVHVGAQKAANTFLEEMRWNKTIGVSEPPGFLQSWWCVFWDLYCAAPERRESHEHSTEAKAFHDYGFVNSGYSVNGMPPNATPSPLPLPPQGHPPPDGMHSQAPFYGGPPFMPNRFPTPRPGARMPQDLQPFNSPPGPPFPEPIMMRPNVILPQQRLPSGGPPGHQRMLTPGGYGRPGMPPGVHPGPGMPGGPPVSMVGPSMMGNSQVMLDAGGPDSMYMRGPPGGMGMGFNAAENSMVGMGDMMMSRDPMEIKSSPAGSQGIGTGTPGPGSVRPPSSDPGMPPEYMGNPIPQHEVPDASSAADNEGIMRVKHDLVEEAKRFEKPDTPGGPSSHGSQVDYFGL